MNTLEETDFGVFVISGDTHLSKWIKEQKRLDVDGTSRDAAARFLEPGDTVVDVGASIGDTTKAYLDVVGQSGSVIAIEPNPLAFSALIKNCPKAVCHNVAFGRKFGMATFHGDDNAGAGWVEMNVPGTVEVKTLDWLNLSRLDFLKIDSEGTEPDVIAGGMETLKECKPIVLLEINRRHLKRAGFTIDDIVNPMAELEYQMELADRRYGLDSDQTDVFFIPR